MNILILGDGLLGSEIIKKTNWDYISRKKDKIDISSFNTLEKYLSKYNIIINCIANTNTYSDNKKDMYNINYKFVINLVNYCNLHYKKLIHISTEFVYSKLNYLNLPSKETDLAVPANNWYSYSKLLADEYILARSKNYLICRCQHKTNNFNYKKVWNVRTSGDTVDKISDIIIKLINGNVTGLYNVGTGDKYLYQLSTIKDFEIVQPPSYVPLDTRMDLTKLNKKLSEI